MTPIQKDKPWLKEPQYRLLKARIQPGAFNGERLCTIEHLQPQGLTEIMIPSGFTFDQEYQKAPRHETMGFIVVCWKEFVANRCFVETAGGDYWVSIEHMEHLPESCLQALFT